MLTSLTVDDGVQRQQYFAHTLLDLMQQASPGVAEPARGQGTKTDPWILETPREWYWAAKNRSDDHSWFAIGGRLIRVQATGAYANYASDYGPVNQHSAPDASSHPPASSSAPVSDLAQRFGEDNGPSYPEIYRKLATDATLGDTTTSQDVAFQIRRLLRGVQEMWAVDSPALPVLTAAFFMGEVRRNYTAFHTGLMLLDLVEAGVSYDLTSPEKLNGPVTLSWDKILWHPDVLRTESELETRFSGFKNKVKNRAAAPLTQDLERAQGNLEALKDEKAEKDIFGRPISRDIRGGDHPMAHTGSIAHSEKDLLGSTGRHSMTMTRQKEANLLIRWLQHVLHKYHPGLRIDVSATNLRDEIIRDEETLSRTSAFARSHVEAAEVDERNLEAIRTQAIAPLLGSAARKKVDRDQGFLASTRYTKAVLFGALIQERCEEFYSML